VLSSRSRASLRCFGQILTILCTAFSLVLRAWASVHVLFFESQQMENPISKTFVLKMMTHMMYASTFALHTCGLTYLKVCTEASRHRYAKKKKLKQYPSKDWREDISKELKESKLELAVTCLTKEIVMKERSHVLGREGMQLLVEIKKLIDDQRYVHFLSCSHS